MWFSVPTSPSSRLSMKCFPGKRVRICISLKFCFDPEVVAVCPWRERQAEAEKVGWFRLEPLERFLINKSVFRTHCALICWLLAKLRQTCSVSAVLKCHCCSECDWWSIRSWGFKHWMLISLRTAAAAVDTQRTLGLFQYMTSIIMWVVYSKLSEMSWKWKIEKWISFLQSFDFSKQTNKQTQNHLY